MSAPPLYPDIGELIEPVALDGAWRIIPIKYVRTPLGAGFGYSRFSAPDRQFKVLYAAGDFTTAFRETLIRDGYDRRKRRRIAAHTLRRHVGVQVDTRDDTRDDLRLVSLIDGRGQNYGVPAAVRNGENYALSQEFALDVYNHTNCDGVLYRSRYSERLCAAVFDRAINKKLKKRMTAGLDRLPQTYDALKELRIDVFRWRGLM